MNLLRDSAVVYLPAEEEKAELGRFSKNFLPIFFNVYSQQPAAGDSGTYRMAVLDTIKVYLTVTKTEVSEARSYSLGRPWAGCASENPDI